MNGPIGAEALQDAFQHNSRDIGSSRLVLRLINRQ